MIIQFAVENFRSIKDEQVLSLVKNSADELSDNYFAPKANATPELLKTAVIYGANASGKSNLLKALACMRHIVINSNDIKPDDKLPVTPFLFEIRTQIEPTTFELIFLTKMLVDDELKYVKTVYGFSCDTQTIYEEWLSVYPKGREQAWFHRIYDDETKKYQWQSSNLFKGNKTLWQETTRSNQLFLSVATQLNSEQLLPVYQFFRKEILAIFSNRIDNTFTKEICRKDENKKNELITFFQQVGIPVQDIIFRPKRAEQFNFPDELPNEFRQAFLDRFLADVDVFFVYQDNHNNTVKIPLEQESDGTQKLFEFIMLLFDAMHNGKTIIIDELNNSLHPKLMQHLVKLFNSASNQGNGQLIFSTHETSVMRQNLLRRDQFWFCKKNQDKSTALYPLTDFAPRKREDIEEAYLNDRYGATPFVYGLEDW